MKQTTKRFLSVILALAFLLSSLLMYWNLIQPAYTEAQQTKAQKNSLQVFFDSEKKVVEQVQVLINSYEGQGEVQRAVSQVLPVGKDVAGALAQVYGLAQNNSLIVKSLSMSVAPALQKKKKGAIDSEISQLSGFATSLQKGVGTISFDVQLGGSYENMKNFLSAVETNIRILDVGQIEVQPAATASTGKSAGANAPSSDMFGYHFAIKTYYQSQ